MKDYSNYIVELELDSWRNKYRLIVNVLFLVVLVITSNLVLGILYYLVGTIIGGTVSYLVKGTKSE